MRTSVWFPNTFIAHAVMFTTGVGGSRIVVEVELKNWLQDDILRVFTAVDFWRIWCVVCGVLGDGKIGNLSWFISSSSSFSEAEGIKRGR